jgi:hypothetical protein
MSVVLEVPYVLLRLDLTRLYVINARFCDAWSTSIDWLRSVLRYYVVHHLPKLKFLDSRPVLESERAQAIKIGHLARVVKPVLATPVCNALHVHKFMYSL